MPLTATRKNVRSRFPDLSLTWRVSSVPSGIPGTFSATVTSDCIGTISGIVVVVVDGGGFGTVVLVELVELVDVELDVELDVVEVLDVELVVVDVLDGALGDVDVVDVLELVDVVGVLVVVGAGVVDVVEEVDVDDDVDDDDDDVDVDDVDEVDVVDEDDDEDDVDDVVLLVVVDGGGASSRRSWGRCPTFVASRDAHPAPLSLADLTTTE